MKQLSTILLVFSFCGLFAQTPCNLNKAITFFNQAQQVEGEKSAELFKQAAEGFKCCKQWNNYAVASYQAANIYLLLENYNQALTLLETCKNDVNDQLAANTPSKMMIFHTLGEVYYKIDNAIQSVENYKLAATCIESIYGSEGSIELAICLFNLGNSYELLQQYNNAIMCHLRSVQMKQTLQNDSSQLSSSFAVLGDLYQRINKLDSSSYYYYLAKSYSTVNSNVTDAAFLKFKMGKQLYDNAQLNEAHENFDEAKNLLETALDVKSEIYSSTNLYLGLIYERKGQLNMAYTCLLRAFQILGADSNKNEYLSTLIPYARVTYKLGRVEEAIKIFEQGLNLAANTGFANEINVALAQIYESKFDLDRADYYFNATINGIGADSLKYPQVYANALIGKGLISSDKEDFSAAIMYFKRAEAIAPATELNIRADIYNYMGSIFLRQKDYENALQKYDQSLKILTQTDGADDLRTLSVEENMANVYIFRGEIEKAYKILKRCEKVKVAKLGEYHIDLIDTYNNLGSANYIISNFEEAGSYLAKALEISQKYSVSTGKLDRLYNNLGLYYKAVGNYKAALRYVDYSIEIKRRLLGAEHPNIANVINNRGTIYDKLGNLNLAMDDFDKAEQIMQKSAMGSSIEISEVYMNKGNLFNKMGQNDFALDYYNKALVLKTGLLSENNPQLADIYSNIGTVYQNLDDLRQARNYYQKALDLRVRNSGAKSQEVAQSYLNIGNILLKASKNDEALANYQRACEIYNSLQMVSPMQIGNAYNNIATAYFRTEKYDTSKIFYQKAVNKYVEAFGSKHPNLSLIYNSMGDLESKIGNYTQALQFYNYAIASNHSNFESDVPVERLPISNGYYDQNIFLNTILSKSMAFVQRYIHTDSLQRDKNDLYTAFNYFALCDSVVQNMRRLTVTKTDKLLLGETALKCYEGALEVCTELMINENDSLKKRYYQEFAYLYIEKSKANALLESMAGQDALDLANIPDSLKKIEKLLSADIQYFERKLAEKPQNSIEVRDSLFNVNMKYNNFIKQLERLYPDYSELKYADKTVGLSDLQASLSNGTQVRMYMIGMSYLFIMNIERNKCEIFSQKVYDNLGDTVKLYRNNIQQSSQKAAIAYRGMAQRFYNFLFPDNPTNEVITQMVIIPDGRLNQIPFESLLYERPQGGFYDYTSYPFLIKKFAISYAYSSSLYYRVLTDNNSSAEISWTGFAPVFTNSKNKGVILDSRMRNFEIREELPDVLPSKEWAPLPSSELEIQDIFDIFNQKGYRAKACLFGSASRRQFCSDSISSFKYIHLATHGFVNSEKPELSGVQFSNYQGDEQKGVLYSSAVYGLKLNCDLLILSACETGLGKIMKGEGIVGLTRAFIYAGTSNLFVSLWKVSDASTSQLMIQLYKELLAADNKNVDYAKFVQKAKLELINGKKFSRPYFWSPFILIGK